MGIETISAKISKAKDLTTLLDAMKNMVLMIQSGHKVIWLMIEDAGYQPHPSRGFPLPAFGLDLYKAKIEEYKKELADLEETFRKWEEIA